MKTPLVFAHANGFPAPCYARLFAGLEKDFSIRYLPRLAHDPAYVVTDGWPQLVAELIHFIEQGPGPVVGLGHSLGGLLSFMAAVERPELFSGLILLDAPIIERRRARVLQLSKRWGFIDRVSPAHATRHRRSHWPDAATAIAHFRTRKLFRHFDPACLEDYVHQGMTADATGLQLWFDPAIESRIYCCIPHRLHSLLPRLHVPTGFIGGRRSRELRLFGLGEMRGRLPIQLIEGGHLFPFEHPQLAAQAVLQMWQQLQAGARR